MKNHKLKYQASKRITALKKMCAMVLACVCKMVCKDTPVLMANNPFRNAMSAVALATMPLVAPIQDVQVDDMVKAYHHEDMYLTASNDEDIYVPGWQDYDYLDITPETWQIGKFIITEEDGSIVEIEANRPKQWFEDYELKEQGDQAFIVIEEMGIANNAELQEIRSTDIDTRSFSLNEEGEVGRPVITTYKRIAKEVSDYTFSNGQVISCTPNHPFFSSDRQAYLPIGELNFGETVQTSSDREVKFIGGKSRKKGEHVYNFEVWREHNYYVGSEGNGDFVLVHNACYKQILDAGEISKIKAALKADGKTDFEIQQILEEVGQIGVDEVLESGSKLKKAAFLALKKKASDFEGAIAKQRFRNDLGLPPNKVVDQVTFEINGVKCRIDYIGLDDATGKYHFGDAKFSTKDKDWNVDWNKTTTDNQAINYPKMINGSGKVKIKVTPGSQKATLLQDLNLANGSEIDFSNLGLRIIGSAADDIAVKSVVVLK